MHLIGGSTRHGPWPVFSRGGGVFEGALWLTVFGWPVGRMGYYFALRMQPPYPGNTPPELLFPELWAAWIGVVALALFLTFSPLHPEPRVSLPEIPRVFSSETWILLFGLGTIGFLVLSAGISISLWLGGWPASVADPTQTRFLKLWIVPEVFGIIFLSGLFWGQIKEYLGDSGSSEST